MSAEVETAEIVLRLIGEGSVQLIKFTSQAGITAGHLATNAAAYVWAIKRGGSPRSIVTNPNGCKTVSIPEDKLEEFKKVAKPYKMPFFTVNHRDYDRGYVDICVKAEDVPLVDRILEVANITTIMETELKMSDLPKELSEAKTFDEAKELLASKATTIDAALNRITEHDLSRDEAFIVCDRNNPSSYISVLPQRAMYNGEEYTMSIYEVYKDGNMVDKLNDARFKNRPIDFWEKQKSNMLTKSGITNGEFVYFKNAESHKEYMDLYKNEKNNPECIDIDMEDLTKKAALSATNSEDKNQLFMNEFVNALNEELKKGTYKEVPAESVLLESQELVNGLKNSKSDTMTDTVKRNKDIDMPGVKDFVKEAKASPDMEFAAEQINHIRENLKGKKL